MVFARSEIDVLNEQPSANDIASTIGRDHVIAELLRDQPDLSPMPDIDQPVGWRWSPRPFSSWAPL